MSGGFMATLWILLLKGYGLVTPTSYYSICTRTSSCWKHFKGTQHVISWTVLFQPHVIGFILSMFQQLRHFTIHLTLSNSEVRPGIVYLVSCPAGKNRRKNPSGNIVHYSWWSAVNVGMGKWKMKNWKQGNVETRKYSSMHSSLISF